MTEQLSEGRIIVGDLGDPDPLPPEFATAMDDDEAPPLEDDPELDRRKAGWVAKLLGVLFQAGGWAGGLRMPRTVKEGIRGLWALDPKDALEIGELLAPMVPDRLVESRVGRAVGTLGVIAGLLKLAGAVGERTEATLQIRHEVIVHASPSPAGAEPATDAGARRPGPRPGSADRPAALDPDAARAVEPVDGFTGAGLGLGEGG